MKRRIFARNPYPASNRCRSIALSGIAVLAISACGRQADDSPLAYVPAETPYAFANLEPTPDAVIDSWSKMLEPLRESYAETLRRARAELAKGGDSEKATRTLSILELFEDKLSIEGWERIGFSRKGRAAIYGVGVLPVIRVELGDPDALRGFMAEIEQRLGEPLPVAEIEGRSYWRFTPDKDKPFALVAAILERHLVLTVDAGPEIAPLTDLLGLNRPERTLLDSGDLAKINSDYGFSPYGTVLVDSRRVLDALIGTQGQETWFTRKLAEDGIAMSDACRAEFAGMAGNMPRLVGGYSRVDAKSMDSNTVLELKPALVQAMQPLAAPVPGLGGEQGDAAFDVGFGMKMDKLAEFIQAQASAIRAEPYACDLLASLNESAEQVGQQMAGLYMAAGWFTGMRAVLSDLTFDSDGKPEHVEGALIIASPNPSGLIGMLKGFVPQLAGIELVAGAEPVQISLDDMGAELGDVELPPVFAALTDSAIGLGVGVDSQTQLKSYMSAPAAEPAPLLYVGYQGAFYARLMKQFEAMAAAGADESADEIASDEMDEMPSDVESDAATQPDDDIDLEIFDEESGGDDALFADDGDGMPGMDADMQHVFQPLMESINELYAIIDYTGVDVVITERGVEMRQVMRLK